MAFEKLKTEQQLTDKPQIYRDLMFVLAQDFFFSSSYGLTIGELAKILQKSEATVRKMVKDLKGLSLIEQHGEKPAFYHIRQYYLESK